MNLYDINHILLYSFIFFPIQIETIDNNTHWV